MTTKRFDPHSPGEELVLTIDFSQELSVGETITSVVGNAWSVDAVVKGTDPSPGDLISGSASIVGAQITQKVKPLIDYVEYRLKCSIQTDKPQILHGFAIFPVKNP